MINHYSVKYDGLIQLNSILFPDHVGVFPYSGTSLKFCPGTNTTRVFTSFNLIMSTSLLYSIQNWSNIVEIVKRW